MVGKGNLAYLNRMVRIQADNHVGRDIPVSAFKLRFMGAENHLVILRLRPCRMIGGTPKLTLPHILDIDIMTCIRVNIRSPAVKHPVLILAEAVPVACQHQLILTV